MFYSIITFDKIFHLSRLTISISTWTIRYIRFPIENISPKT
jgi:hypothetical protein